MTRVPAADSGIPFEPIGVACCKGNKAVWPEHRSQCQSAMTHWDAEQWCQIHGDGFELCSAQQIREGKIHNTAKTCRSLFNFYWSSDECPYNGPDIPDNLKKCNSDHLPWRETNATMGGYACGHFNQWYGCSAWHNGGPPPYQNPDSWRR